MNLLVSSLSFAITSLILSIVIPLFARKKIALMWAFFNLLVALWGFCLAGVYLSGDNHYQSLNWWRAGICFGAMLAIVFYHFVAMFCKYKGKNFLVISYVLGFIFIYLISSGKMSLHLRLLKDGYLYPTGIDPLFHALAIFWLSCIFYGLWILFQAYQSATSEDQVGIKYLIVGFLIGFSSGGAFHWLTAYRLPINPTCNVLVSAYTLLSTYAIFRHNLLGMDFVVRKSLAYTIVISLTTTLYFSFLYLIERIFQHSLGYNSAYSIAILIICVLIAEPLRITVQSYLDHIFYKGNIEQLSDQRNFLEKEMAKQDKLKAVATLAAGMAHEIKNPLTSIRTFAEYLPEKYDDPEFRLKFRRIVMDEVDRVNNIVTQLLEFSKPADLDLAKLSPVIVLEDTLDLLNKNLVDNKIDVIKRFDSTEDLMIDKNQLKQAFLNIFLNGIQAMPEGGCFTIGAYSRNGHFEITISDTGYGISKESLPHIFDPFFTRKEEGTGLGLSIVHGIIKEHGGKIEVKSEVGKGTEFRIYLKSMHP